MSIKIDGKTYARARSNSGKEGLTVEYSKWQGCFIVKLWTYYSWVEVLRYDNLTDAMRAYKRQIDGPLSNCVPMR